MTIYFDYIGHMISDTSIEELHDFAKNKMKFKPEWFQNKGRGKGWIPHYDLTTPNAKKRAKSVGAIQIEPLELVKILRNAPYINRWEEYIGQGMS